MSERKKILLIEDEPDFRFGVRMQLEASGYDVLEAEDGAAGLDAARTQSPDLIILDCQMPKMDGYEVARQLKGDEKHRDIPILMLTASSQESDRQKSADAGAEGYLRKPFDPMELLKMITELLEKA
jgi:CheY-like chemotaxis protein